MSACLETPLHSIEIDFRFLGTEKHHFDLIS